MSASIESVNVFSSLSLNAVEPFIPKIESKKKSVSKTTAVVKHQKDVILDLQNNYPLMLILFSGATNNEYVIGKTKISSDMKLKKNATIQDLNLKINSMKLPYSCVVWCSTINTPELKKMIDNQYSLPEKYHHLHDKMCDDTIKNMKSQKVIILDFRRPHLKGKEYVYLKNHQQFFFGSVRETYLTQKSEVHGFKNFYDNVCHKINFVELDKVILECHKCALTFDDTDWINFRENQIHQFRDAASVFEMSDKKVFERFTSFENLRKEAELVKNFKNEILEMLPKMKNKYDSKMLAMDVRINYDEAFPSL